MKYENDHLRAQALLAESLTDSLPADDARWLGAHLRECPACEAVLAAQRDAIHVLKTIPARTPAFLAALTKARVHSRRRQIEESRQRMQLLVISCVLALAWTVASMPIAWELVQWFGVSSPVTANAVWWVAIVWFWAAPALAGAALVFTHREGQSSLFRSAMMRRLGHE